MHADQALARKLGQRYAELSARSSRAYRELAARSATTSRPPASSPPRTSRSPPRPAALDGSRRAAEERLRHLLVPRDPDDGKDVILEIKAGEGGEESALFAGDLLRMYPRYAETRGWRTEMLDATESDLGGYKAVTVAVKAKGTPEPGEAPYALLKFEGGVHRVQRVPVTESQGRIHTSAAGVLVMPEAEQVDVDDRRERPAHRRLPLLGTGRAERQHDRLRGPDHPPADRHRGLLPEREVASCRTRSRRCASCGPGCSPRPGGGRRGGVGRARRSQVRTVDRSERIRTYNYPENRISDHRTGYKAYNLDQVLDGDLEAVVEACVQADLAARLAGARVT